MVSFIALTIKMIMQVVYIMGMWSVLADRKFIEMRCSICSNERKCLTFKLHFCLTSGFMTL